MGYHHFENSLFTEKKVSVLQSVPPLGGVESAAVELQGAVAGGK